MYPAPAFCITLSALLYLGLSANLRVFQPPTVSVCLDQSSQQLFVQADETTDSSPPRGSPRRDAAVRV